MKRMLLIWMACMPILIYSQTIDLSGEWQFKEDPKDVGITENWATKDFNEIIKLPGSMTTNGKGIYISPETHWTGWVADSAWFNLPKYAKYREKGNVKIIFWLQPKKTYVGAAWYKRTFQIPQSMSGKPVQLTLERVHWEGTVWIDGKMLEMQNSLSTPHQYVIQNLTPGQHTIAIRVDNRIKDIDMGMNAHSVSDQTQTNWNGITGKMIIEAKPSLFISNIKIFPDNDKKEARVIVSLNNTSGKSLSGIMKIGAESMFSPTKQTINPVSKTVSVSDSKNEIELIYPMGNNFYQWDEFTPYLYSMQVSFTSGNISDTSSSTFGMRKLSTHGTQLAVNDRTIFLRGTLDCAIFPRTGYPSTDIKEWRRIFNVCKSHGLNHVRFHSWCPPEAAFYAADELGIYLQVEGAGWTAVGNGTPYDKYIYEESDRIMEQYGNHPSFLLYTYGNEPNGDNMNRFLGDLITHLKKTDPRHKYTSAAGWPAIPENDYNNDMHPRIYVWYDGLNSYINAHAPSSDYDWYAKTSKYDIPYVSHEVGNWCVYPNFKEIDKYDGVVQAKNFEVFRDVLKENGLANLADSFLLASGKLQALCYKAEIEAAFRTKGFAGFQLLSLQDFPGQGTALVGILDAFWEEKGYISPAEFKRFSGETVPLVRLPKMTYTNEETFKVPVEIAHFGQKILKNVTPSWTITKENGEIVTYGNLTRQDIAIGNCIPLGEISYPLNRITEPCKLILTVNIQDKSNHWDIWVYPVQKEALDKNVWVTDTLDSKTLAFLEKGGNVLFSPKKGSIKEGAGGEIILGFSTIFWNTAWTVHQQPPHVMGILTDPSQPALKQFPTDYYSNYQWWDIMMNANVIKLPALDPDLKPIVRVIDDWFLGQSLGLIVEAKVGKGKMIISGADLLSNPENRLEARQLTYSLTQYMKSGDFNPQKTISINKIKDIIR